MKWTLIGWMVALAATILIAAFLDRRDKKRKTAQREARIVKIVVEDQIGVKSEM